MSYKAIPEATYLTVSNVEIYRRILRFFYVEYEKMNFQLVKEDVYNYLKQEMDITMEECKSSLDALVGWKNLIAIQDPTRVFTIEDYKNKQFRYSMSEVAVEIERLTIRLENLVIESGTLSTQLFSRISSYFNEMELYKYSSSQLNQWWHDLQEDFKRLNQNYQDYLREFYSGKSEKLMKSLEFILHKDRFITYLKDFIQECQIHSLKIEKSIMMLNNEDELLNRIIASELEIPHPSVTDMEQYALQVRANVLGKWKSLKYWFVNEKDRRSESSRVMEITDDIIRKIIQNAMMIVKMQHWTLSKKEDYKHYMALFKQCETLDEAHCLSAYMFGVMSIQHYRALNQRLTDSVNSSTYDEEANIVACQSRVRAYVPKIDKSAKKDKNFEKIQQKEQYLAEKHQERLDIERWIVDGVIDLRNFDEPISPVVRKALMSWISLALRQENDEKVARNEYGMRYRCVDLHEEIELVCSDGTLVMPSYRLEFIGDYNE